MIGFFPAPYPDELLYSVVARYYVWSANLSPKAALQELFGKTTAIATFDLPSHLTSLISNLPRGSKHTAESLIRQNTLFPFYAPFLPLERSQAVFASMCGDYSGDIHTRVGIMASAIPQIEFFRFCPLCVREDTEEYGEPYWHRVHQIAGVLICPQHRVCLQNSSVKIQGDNRHEFCAADAENCVFRLAVAERTKSTLDKLLLLTQDVGSILNLNLPTRSGEWFRNRYQSLLIAKGLATPSGRILQKELARELTDFYGNDFLKCVYSVIDVANEDNWLSSIVRKHRKAFHPIRHLLLIRFLNQEVAAFFGNEKDAKPFGSGAWTCFNAASKHYLEKTITSVSVSYSRDAKKLVGTFSCACGFIYSTSDAAVPGSEKLSFGKIKSFGKIWERKLKKLLTETKVSLREAARQLKVDIRTVVRHAKRLELIDPKAAADVEMQLNSEVKSAASANENNRAAWLQARKSYPRLSKTELRKKNPAVFARLYRSDRKWLEQNSPKNNRTNNGNQTVNWAQRDEQILVSAEKVIKMLRGQTPLVRITVGSAAKKLGLRALLEKHLDKTPLTKAFLLSQVESVEEFQIRRVRFAAQELSARNANIKVWEVFRAAGLRSSCSATVRQAIEDQVLQINSRYFTALKTAV